jgi:hypothetical protein
MTIGHDDTTATPAAVPVEPVSTEPKPNGLQRVIGALFSPDATFASIARRPDWLVPVAIMVILSLGVGLIIAQRVDFAAPAREAMEQNKNASPEQVERAVKMSAGIGKVFSYLSPILVVISLLVMAGVLLLAFRLFGGEGDFHQAFSATAYASMPTVVRSLVLLIILLARGGSDLIPAQTLGTIVRSNLGFLVDMKTNPMAFALLSSVDIFTIWFVVLLIIGFAHLARVSKGKAAGIVISLWAVTIVFKLIPAALQSLRASR